MNMSRIGRQLHPRANSLLSSCGCRAALPYSQPRVQAPSAGRDALAHAGFLTAYPVVYLPPPWVLPSASPAPRRPLASHITGTKWPPVSSIYSIPIVSIPNEPTNKISGQSCLHKIGVQDQKFKQCVPDRTACIWSLRWDVEGHSSKAAWANSPRQPGQTVQGSLGK
jgi:hypothetical protein